MIKFLQHFPLAKTFIREMTEVNPNANFASPKFARFEK